MGKVGTRGLRQGTWAWGPGTGEQPHMGVFIGVDDLALAVHDTVDGDARNDIGLDELKLVYKLC